MVICECYIGGGGEPDQNGLDLGVIVHCDAHEAGFRLYETRMLVDELMASGKGFHIDAVPPTLQPTYPLWTVLGKS